MTWYRVETFPHYSKDSIVTYSENLMGLSEGVNVVYLEEGKPSYINVRQATDEEVDWLDTSLRDGFRMMFYHS